ncbi:hypothetical protein AVEN_174443-1 [Araneus ventricosus]|uniref:Uncharacterized protein n=1 Tax=Araneus ventricosus TaxID=182803 RepID=A0A4Y2RL05_ARAVE|nr:hypothetical protein AVEN_174443-1 [Araneus ventricosus]
MSCCRISKQELASPVDTKMVGGVLPPSGDSTYLLREGSVHGRNWLLGLRRQYSSYCSGCHLFTRVLRQGRVFLVIYSLAMETGFNVDCAKSGSTSFIVSPTNLHADVVRPDPMRILGHSNCVL